MQGLWMSWLLLAAVGAASEQPVQVEFARQVRAEGDIRERLERAIARLATPPLHHDAFVLSDVSFEMKRRFTEYSGDISGRMLGALQAAEDVLPGPQERVETLLQRLPDHQQPDGHFGAPQDLAAGVMQERDMPILWGNGRLLLALCEVYRVRPQPRFLETARRIGDYVISTRPFYGKRENFEGVGGIYASGFTTCYPSLIDGMAALAEVTGEAKYADEARFIARLSLLDRAFEKHHSHGRLTAYRGMLDLDHQSGKPEFLDTIVSECARLREGFLLPTGGITETFDRTYIHDEGCTEADWVRVNLLLWRATGKTEYLDAAEAVLRNHLLAAQFLNGGFGHRSLTALREGEKRYPCGGFDNTGGEAYWCCAMHGAQVLTDVVRWGVVGNRENLWVTWLSEGSWNFGEEESAVKARLTKTSPHAWQVLIESNSPKPIVTHLRVPGWTQKIRINGADHKATDGWVTTKHEARPGGRLSVEFESGIRIAGMFTAERKAGEPVRLFMGSDLLCLPESELEPGFLPPDAVPTLRLSQSAAKSDRPWVAVASADGASWRSARLTTMADRPVGACRFLFHVDAGSADTTVEIPPPSRPPTVGIETVFGCGGQWRMYLNGRLLTEGQGFAGQCSVISATTRTGSNELAVFARGKEPNPMIIGLVRTSRGVVSVSSPAWTAHRCDEAGLAEYLKTLSPPRTEPVPLRDFGGVGIGPMHYIPGDYLDTNARWIWPEKADHPDDAGWLVRCRFDAQP